MSNSTVFISGFSLGINENDDIVILRLIDSVQEDREDTYSFALPNMVSKQLYDSLKNILEDDIEEKPKKNTESD